MRVYIGQFYEANDRAQKEFSRDKARSGVGLISNKCARAHLAAAAASTQKEDKVWICTEASGAPRQTHTRGALGACLAAAAKAAA
jgi:hypothetical protein